MSTTDVLPSSPPAIRGGAADGVLAAAVEFARAAAVDEAGEAARVGAYLGASADGERLVVHSFAVAGGLAKAYPGWQWSVELSRAARAKTATVDEVVLLPGTGAILPKPWLPWSNRIQPGDLGPGDLLPPPADDPRLVLRIADVEERADTGILMEQGIGRPRALSFEGRVDAAERWYAGDSGPDTPIAQLAPARCLTCGFHIRLAGGLGQVFAVCANSWAPDDGRVVALDHGCGAHSETVTVAGSLWEAPVVEHEYDLAFEAGPEAHTPGSVADAEPAEPYGHS